MYAHVYIYIYTHKCMRVYIRAKLYIVFDFTIAELVKRICPGLISAR